MTVEDAQAIRKLVEDWAKAGFIARLYAEGATWFAGSATAGGPR